MIFIKPVRRKIVPAGPVSGKPTVPFSPNFSYPHYPSRNSLHFTNLISGQTAYIEDSVSGRQDFAYGGGTMGVHAEGEGYKLDQCQTQGGNCDFDNAGLNSYAVLIQFVMWPQASGSYIYCSGFLPGYYASINNRYLTCAANGPGTRTGAHSGPGEICLPGIDDQQIHTVGIRNWRFSGGFEFGVYQDGAAIHEDSTTDVRMSSGQDYTIGNHSSSGSGQPFLALGLWAWHPSNWDDNPIPAANLQELTSDPWQYLITVD